MHRLLFVKGFIYFQNEILVVYVQNCFIHFVVDRLCAVLVLVKTELYVLSTVESE